MRIWSLHPSLLDSKGLVALWRETLLAKHVLEGRTKGYRQHPQLHRFKACDQPLPAINAYLETVYNEAVNRKYRFDNSKFCASPGQITLKVTRGQMEYEFLHLMSKLKSRDKNLYTRLKTEKAILPHPLFEVVEGGIEEWEIV